MCLFVLGEGREVRVGGVVWMRSMVCILMFWRGSDGGRSLGLYTYVGEMKAFEKSGSIERFLAARWKYAKLPRG